MPLGIFPITHAQKAKPVEKVSDERLKWMANWTPTSNAEMEHYEDLRLMAHELLAVRKKIELMENVVEAAKEALPLCPICDAENFEIVCLCSGTVGGKPYDDIADALTAYEEAAK